MLRTPDCNELTPFRSSRFWIFGVAVLTVVLGCTPGGAPDGGTTAPAAVSGESAQPSVAAGTTDGIPAALVTKVEDLIRLTGEYNALAAKVQDVETIKQHRDALSAIENQLSPIVEDVMIAQAKLSPQLSDQFDRQYYDGRAKPLIAEKARHQQRISMIVP